MKKLNRKGFTIIELVIVIAVIAILAAVMVPTFSSIVTKAKMSAAEQEAKACYKEIYALDWSDGKLDGNDGKDENGKDNPIATANGDIAVGNIRIYTIAPSDSSNIEKYITYSVSTSGTTTTISFTYNVIGGYTVTYNGTKWETK